MSLGARQIGIAGSAGLADLASDLDGLGERPPRVGGAPSHRQRLCQRQQRADRALGIRGLAIERRALPVMRERRFDLAAPAPEVPLHERRGRRRPPRPAARGETERPIERPPRCRQVAELDEEVGGVHQGGQELGVGTEPPQLANRA